MKLEKITESGPRWYNDACGAAHALELVGERWTLLIMRELMFGPRRFGDLRASLPGLSANVLTQRLERLEGEGIVVRRRLSPPASVQVYALTPWGLESEPIFQTLGRWAARSPSHDATLPLSPISLMMSLATMFQRDRAEALLTKDERIAVDFRFGEAVFHAVAARDAVATGRGGAKTADLTLTGNPSSVAALVYGEMHEPEELGLTVGGDRSQLAQFCDLFALPPKI